MSKCIELFDSSPIIDAISFADFDEISISNCSEGLVNIQSLTANLGEDVHLPCKSYAENFLQYRISLNGVEAMRLTEDGSLVISNVQDFDNGTYRCKVSLLNRSPESKDDYSYVDLQIIAFPRFKIKPPSIIAIDLGQSLRLSCQSLGNPAPMTTWFKDNKLLTTNSHVFIKQDELLIAELEHNDFGVYRCISSNSVGSINAVIQIVDAKSTTITVRPKNVTKIEGDRIEILCKCDIASTKIAYKWTHNDEAITVNENDSRFNITLNILTIDSLVFKDSGRYTCEVFDESHFIGSAFAFLRIECNYLYYPAKANLTPNLQYLPLKLFGKIFCNVKAVPSVRYVQWMKNDRLLGDDHFSGVHNYNNGTLYFSKVTPENEGTYQCIPFNIHGTSGPSQRIKVRVRDPPFFIETPEKLYVKSINEDISIPCMGSGEPLPTIEWRKAGQVLLLNDRISIDHESISIKRLQKIDHGKYECIISNSIASLNFSTTLIVNNTSPQTPTNVFVKTYNSKATIRWDANYDGGHNQTFVLSFRILNLNNFDDWRTIYVPSSETGNQFTLYNLKSDTQYEFRMYAMNEIGLSDPSPVFIAKTESKCS
ncbi:Protein turtle [Sarcoptes scabiei]|uniref:Protein turtle n=1 Tax=Sarcoptes scabiei TaxID=52283 RepID=A0A834VB74_SARSC|nr:Protein turtle [Sarcoptes scabiei]